VRLQQINRSCKVDNIIEAYYALKESTIENSFKKCGYFEGDASEIVQRAAAQGYIASQNRQSDMARYRSAFLDWARHNTREATDVLPRSKKAKALADGLDGVQWRHLGTSRRKNNTK